MTQINVSGNVEANLIGTVSGGEVQMTYSPNDLEAIRLLVNDIFDHRKEIGLSPEQLIDSKPMPGNSGADDKPET